MATPNAPQRTLFTFRRNGDNQGKRLVEIMAEPMEQHQAPAGAAKLSWFGAEDDVAAISGTLEFASAEVEGVLGSLHTNRDATRELDVLPSDLIDAGFNPSA